MNTEPSYYIDLLKYDINHEVLTLEQARFVKGVLRMAGVGKTYNFHGSFITKGEADKKQKETGGFVRERNVQGKKRFFVLSEKTK